MLIEILYNKYVNILTNLLLKNFIDHYRFFIFEFFVFAFIFTWKKIYFFHCAKKHSFFIFAMKSHRKCDVHCFVISYQHFVLFYNVKTMLFQKFKNANLTQRHIVTNVLFRTIFLFRKKNVNDIVAGLGL